MKVPTSTYRLQLNAELRLAQVRELIPYFSSLGVGYLYLSPIFQARPLSQHGYDVANPTQLNREIGDEAEFAALGSALHAAGIGVMLDIVPNHMAADAVNPWWRDVLEHGPASLAASFFAISWDAPGCSERVILPVLGRALSDALAAGELGITHSDGELQVAYFERTFPLDPATYDTIVAELPGARPLAAAARAIGPRRATDMDVRQQRRDAGLALKQALALWVDSSPEHRRALDHRLASLSESDLRAVLDRQAYRLEFWRTGSQHLNYRRFFNISDLAAVRVEDAAVFTTTHALVFDLIRAGQVDGIRIDHVDGLRDPAAYLHRLRAAVGDEYLVVEKVLAPTEELPESWPVEGTTGYDFIGLTAGLGCEPHGLGQLLADYSRRTDSPPFAEIVYQKKKLVIDVLFTAELQALAARLEDIARRAELAVDRETLAACLTEVTAAMQVYRTYVTDEPSAYDRTVIKHAVTCARHRAPNIPDSVYVLLRNLLLREAVPADAADLVREFTADWQQFTGPVMAKGLEDTAFYVHNALIAQCEVGAQPDTQMASAAELHETIGRRVRRWPYTMNASSTHDTKRSEDMRARIQVLTELSDTWTAALDRWFDLADRHVEDVDGTRVPAANEMLLIFQTLVGAWPLDGKISDDLVSRLRAFTFKAAREAKTLSNWREPNQEYEKAFARFGERLLHDPDFVADFGRFHEPIAWYGALNSLAQLVLKLGCPGVPDLYQGNETWRFNLVDPDNRGTVAFDALQDLLTRLPDSAGANGAGELLSEWRDGRIKLHVTRAGLQLRRERAQLFLNGSFIPIQVHGRFAENVIAFARRAETEWALVVAGRYYSQLGPRPVGTAWGDTRLELPANAPSRWRNVFTGEITGGSALEAVFATLPFAILTGT